MDSVEHLLQTAREAIAKLKQEIADLTRQMDQGARADTQMALQVTQAVVAATAAAACRR